jgi:predicted enzyme related to lactoylglutathione lyase
MSAAKPQNAAVWFEIPAADFDRAVGFYEKVFDTRLKREKFGPADMAVFPAEEKGVAGAAMACRLHDKGHAEGPPGRQHA